MDVKQAIELARTHLETIYAQDGMTQLEVEEFEHDKAHQRWIVTLAFTRPWTTARTRAQEVLEQMGAVSGTRRAVKSVTIGEDGDVVSMKNYSRPEPVG